MKIAVAQTKPVKGDMQSNIDKHKALINLAVTGNATIIVFPELSLTGYEPELAKALAIEANDTRLDAFQAISDTDGITIGAGAPMKTAAGTCIGMLLFRPRQPRQVYFKQYLHADEEPYFVSGQNTACLSGMEPPVALAICYELSVPEHAEHAFKSGVAIYLTSVAKSAGGVAKAIDRLSHIARTYSMTVLMSNCIGECGGDECAGKTSAWNNKGELAGQLNNTVEGILIVDTDTEEIIKKIL